MSDYFMAIDVGVGTQDIMMSKDGCISENNIKLVLPSPTRLKAKMVKNSNSDIFCNGYTMGGGPLSKELERHAANHKVVMTPDAGRTVSDDLEEVKDRGIEIKDCPTGSSFDIIKLGDLMLTELNSALGGFGIKKTSEIGVAVQDHGVAPKGMSDRKFRFEFIRDVIENRGRFEDFVFKEKSGRFSRIDAALKNMNDLGIDGFAMDSKIAALLGCIESDSPHLVVDAGNGHFMAATVKNKEILGIMEHHTRKLDEAKIKKFLQKLVNGDLKNEEVFEDGGHGACALEGIKTKNIEKRLTGPQRGVVPKSLGFKQACPAGDVMMTGPVGIFKASQMIE